jgi:ribosomal protein S18 acetylase RimI-like enzyme
VIELRDAAGADLPALIALWRLMDSLHAQLLPRFFRRPAPSGGAVPARAREEIGRILRATDEKVRVAVEDGAVVGLCHTQVYDTPPQPSLTPARRAHIDSLVVLESARRRGIGRKLVDDAAAWGRSRGASEMVLTVWAGNHEAERFYHALGFDRVSSVLGRAL